MRKQKQIYRIDLLILAFFPFGEMRKFKSISVCGGREKSAMYSWIRVIEFDTEEENC